MTEQQRFFLAITLCLGIFVTWQTLLPPVVPDIAPNDTTVLAQNTEHATPALPSIPVLPQTKTPVVPHVIEKHAIDTPLLKAEISNDNIAITQWELKNYQNAQQQPMSLLDGQAQDASQARISWLLADDSTPHFVFDMGASTHDRMVLRSTDAQGLQLVVDMRTHADSYALDYVLRATNISSQVQHVGAYITLGLSPSQDTEQKLFFAPSADPLHALCDVGGSLDRKQLSDVEGATWQPDSTARWVALDKQYFLVALVPQPDTSAHAKAPMCAVESHSGVLYARLHFGKEILQPGASFEKHVHLYAGPKRDNYLTQVSPLLTESIDYNIWHIPLGFLARPMVFLLNLFHQWTYSWGLAIMLLTLMVKILLFPLSYKSALSLRNMQLLRPDIERIKKQFAQNKEQQQIEQMKLFKQRGVNPLGGCLPQLLQMPVGIALYRTLLSAIDLYQQPFLWLPDLTAKEPLPILAIAFGLLMVVQQKLTPAMVDNQQAKVMMFVMPVMLTFFMIALPSGLILYILVNSILTIIQQLAINKYAAKAQS